MTNELADRVSAWMNGNNFILISNYERITLPRDIFEFDIQGTIDQFQQENKRSFFSFLKTSKSVQLPLKVFIKQNHDDIKHLQSLDYINHEKVMQQLLNVAENLAEDSFKLSYTDEENLPFEEVAKNEQTIPEDLSQAILNNLMNDLNEQVIKPQGIFSLLESIKLPSALENSSEELSFVATSLYEIVLQTNLAIIDRHHHLQLPKYAKPGLDVLIDQHNDKDFLVQNNDATAYQIKASIENDKWHISIHSLAQEFVYHYDAKNEQIIPPRTIYRYSKDLSPGEEKLIQKGKDGLAIEIFRETYGTSSEPLNSERMSKDVYLPTPEIILTATEDLPEDNELTEETVDPDEVDAELDELEQNLSNVNKWLTGDIDDADDLEEMTLWPFLSIVPPFETNEGQSSTERLTELEEMIANREQEETDEILLTRLVDLELRLEALKELYDELIDTLDTHDLLNKGDDEQ